jgi:hypothetical protein
MSDGLAISTAHETGEEALVPYLDMPVVAVPPVEEPRPLRLAVPLLLAAGWGALLTFSVMFLMEDNHSPAVAADRAAVAERSDLERLRESRTRQPEVATVVAAVEPAIATPAVLKVATASAEAMPSATAAAATAAPNPAVSAPATTPSPAAAAHQSGLPIERANYVGTWGPTTQACGARSRRRGYLPAQITEGSARAGRTLCRFRNGKRDGIAWTMSADCSDRGRSWTSQVRLLVDGDRLIWTSAKGSASYVRCGRREG